MAEVKQTEIPTVIVSELDLTYRVFGVNSRDSAPKQEAPTDRFRQLLGRRPATGVREIPAVKNVSFVANHGESIGVIGRNGSGKSTLLRAIAGLMPPTRGAVYVSGQASLLGVNAVLMRQLSGRRNIMIGAQALGMTPEEAEAAVPGIVEFADIGEFIDLPMSAYSSGMAARLRFAISTAAVPDVLMVDEALATGDAAFRARSRERIEEIRKAAGTVFLVSHNATTIKDVCERALWMEKGRLIMDGPVEQVLEAYQERYPSKGKKKSRPPSAAPKSSEGAASDRAKTTQKDDQDNPGKK